MIRIMGADLRNAFEKYAADAWKYRYDVGVHIHSIAGGVPTDPHVAEMWLRTKLGPEHKDDQIRAMAAEVMLERNITLDEAMEELDKRKHLNGFRRNVTDKVTGQLAYPTLEEGQLLILGYMVKAALKEAASVAAAAGKIPLTKWGKTSKYLHGFVAEHIMVVEHAIGLTTCTGHDPQTGEPLGKCLPITEPTGVLQSFPENKRIGMRGIQYAEFVKDPDITFQVVSDWEFALDQWAMIWETGKMQGLGASRSQEFGRYQVVKWERV